MKHPPQASDLVPGRTIGLVGLGVVVTTIAGALIAYGIGACATENVRAGAASLVVPAEVSGVETTPFVREAQGLELVRRADVYLSTYGWVDREREIVHVPLDVAVELYLARRGGGTP